MLRETSKRQTREEQSTEAKHRDGRVRTVCWAAPRSGGLESHWRSDRGAISISGGNASLAGVS